MEVGQMKVFISHITEESALADVLKNWIESTFLGQVDVFVSGNDISSGEQWFRRLGEELTDAKAMLVLCSERSVSRPWINFEAGAGHVKGVPVIPICYAGVNKDTLPVPLFFFQALDVGAEDFGVRVIGDLAKHLGYKRTPLIRHEEMTADLEKALSHLEQESGNNVGGELGFQDHLDLFIERTEAMTSLVSAFVDNSSQITIEVRKYTNQAKRAGDNPSPEKPGHLQNIAKQLGLELIDYANNIEGLNRKYGEVLPEIKSSLQPLLTFTDLETTSGMAVVDKFLATLDETEQNVSDWRNAVLDTHDTISELPNFQRDVNRGNRRVREEFETLTSNLEATLDMLQEAKATINSRLERRSLDQEIRLG